jgi:hypothetical protein
LLIAHLDAVRPPRYHELEKCFIDNALGFLTGAYKSPDDFETDDFRRTLPRFQGEAFKEVRALNVYGERVSKSLTTSGRTSS